MSESHNPYQAPSASVADVMLPDDGPWRIGGWLYLLGFGLIVRAAVLPFGIWGLFSPFVMQEGGWERLGALPNATGLRALIVTELLINLLIWSLTLWATFLFFKRRARFKRVLLILLTVSFCFYTMDHFLGQALLPAELLDDQGESLKLVWQSLVYGLIWGNYVLRSERVEHTFVL